MQPIGYWQSLKRKLIVWLARELEAERVRQHRAADATIAPTATLAPEAAIENFAGGPARVVVGNHSYIRGRLLTYGHGGYITIGEWCYVGIRSEIWSMDSITIGNRVMIGHDVNIHDGTGHSHDAAQRHAHFRHILERGHVRSREELPGIASAPVVIEEDVSIGFGAIILQGVRLGAASIIAPGSVVIRDVPPGVIYSSFPKPTFIPIKLFK